MIRCPLFSILTFLASYTGHWSTVPPPDRGAQPWSIAQPTAGACCPVRPCGHRIPQTTPAPKRKIQRNIPYCSVQRLRATWRAQQRQKLRLSLPLGHKNILTGGLVKGAVRARSRTNGGCLKNFRCALRFTSAGARASSWVRLSDTRALSPNHAYTFPWKTCVF